MSASEPNNEMILRGISASPGIAYGPTFVYRKAELEVPEFKLADEKLGGEIERLNNALMKTRTQITVIRDQVERNLGPEEARIFDAHLLVLEDQALISETEREIENTRKNVEACFNTVAQRYIQAFAEIDDEYLRERAGDIRDVTSRVLHNLLGQTSENLSQLLGRRIVVADDIAPSDAATLDRSSAMGLITESGSKTSHAVIVARSMKVPAVVGVREVLAQVDDGDEVIIDGYDGVVIIRPSESTLFRYGERRTEKQSFEKRLMDAVGEPSVTLDGHAVPLRANIEKEDEVDFVKEHAGEGVGLFRSEYLYLASPVVPSEEQQLRSYRTVAEAFGQEPVVIRTLDLGGDKPMTGAPHLFPREDNPFLGFRAIRFCLEHRDIFKSQLRAILRASAHGNVHLMFPMISGTREMREARAVLVECQEELRAEGVPFNEAMPIGSMIEIPSAALTSDSLARECDFFSIGTNDLIQYLIAIDRVNDRTAHLYEPSHPAVIRVIREVVENAHAAGIKVSVCGEMAGDPIFVPLLVGLGVDELSMTPPLLPACKFVIRAMTAVDARDLADQASSMSSPEEIERLCIDFYKRCMSRGA
ncbi:phosphoenolpyruvate--protein phosphotransferase [Synoicihabitans lomoniglobus]|uniref:Phosphoenolpyruvate-protein phosphotransferase n=1 Tax=Synoicihabitans lomoniglobus TaxID=2909285 RepID=A0AAF0CSZ6_9BACT|nr:phosphoenolpyruvate--protein phosphotransferase [Opitutaceae bacterium LMO-M01]WED67473.1 phosphoenolpyruvate--protein phosphotransferase [Opitutaceae bacterium LMO-M01]